MKELQQLAIPCPPLQAVIKSAFGVSPVSCQWNPFSPLVQVPSGNGSSSTGFVNLRSLSLLFLHPSQQPALNKSQMLPLVRPEARQARYVRSSVMVSVLDKTVIPATMVVSLSFLNQLRVTGNATYSGLQQKKEINALRTFGLTKSGCMRYKGLGSF